MDVTEIHDAFNEAREGYIGPDTTFVLTEKGKQYLESLKNGELNV